MPRRWNLNFLHRDTSEHRSEPTRATNPVYTVNTTVNMNEWHPVSWNTTQWFPDNEDIAASRVTRQMLENAYNNMTARDVMEMAEATPERMLRLVRLNMPELANNLFEERPMDPPRDWGAEAISRATRVPANYFSADYNEPITYTPTPYWSNRTISWAWGDKLGGHVEYRRGKIIRVKRYCKI